MRFSHRLTLETGGVGSHYEHPYSSRSRDAIPDGGEKLRVAPRIHEWVPGGDPWELRPETSPDPVGQRVDIRSLPNLGGTADGDELTASAVNGEIAAMTRSYVFEGEAAVLAMVRPEHFVNGANRIEFLEVKVDGDLRLIASSG